MNFTFPMCKSRVFIVLTLFIFFTACIKEDIGMPYYNSAQAYTLQNVFYGNHYQQNMDIYLPANRNATSTKVFVMVHGGAWSAGDKSEFSFFFNSFKIAYPNHAIININYRLGTANNPGFPKQIEDLKAAIKHIQQANYQVSKQYFLIGSSAGSHLSMLYGYGYDPQKEVKGICNTVGPADITDSAYTNNVFYMNIMKNLVGNATIANNPNLFAQVSPTKQVTAQSPPTLSFYGDSDVLIPNSQLQLLIAALSAKGVYHEYTVYQGEGHGGWNQANSADAGQKLSNFIQQFFN